MFSRFRAAGTTARLAIDTWQPTRRLIRLLHNTRAALKENPSKFEDLNAAIRQRIGYNPHAPGADQKLGARIYDLIFRRTPTYATLIVLFTVVAGAWWSHGVDYYWKEHNKGLLFADIIDKFPKWPPGTVDPDAPPAEEDDDEDEEEEEGEKEGGDKEEKEGGDKEEGEKADDDEGVKKAEAAPAAAAATAATTTHKDDKKKDDKTPAPPAAAAPPAKKEDPPAAAAAKKTDEKKTGREERRDKKRHPH